MYIWIFLSKKGNLHLGLILLAVPQPSDVYLHGAVVSGDVVAFGEESMALVGMYPTPFHGPRNLSLSQCVFSLMYGCSFRAERWIPTS